MFTHPQWVEGETEGMGEVPNHAVNCSLWHLLLNRVDYSGRGEFLVIGGTEA